MSLGVKGVVILLLVLPRMTCSNNTPCNSIMFISFVVVRTTPHSCVTYGRYENTVGGVYVVLLYSQGRKDPRTGPPPLSTLRPSYDSTPVTGYPSTGGLDDSGNSLKRLTLTLPTSNMSPEW